jgi:hypothetical protein
MRPIKYLHYLSLDVVFGAILYQLFWSKCASQFFPPISHVIALFVAIWLIYLVDRRIDSNIEKPLDGRHQFQYKNKRWIDIFIVILGLVSIANLFFLPLGLIQIGVVLLIGIIFYWLIWWKGWFDIIFGSKEFITAFFYTLGIGASSLYQMGFHQSFVEIFFLMYLCVLQNLLLFSSLEKPDHVIRKYFLMVIELVFVLFILAIIYTHPSFEIIILLIPFLITFCLQFWIHYFAYSIQQRFIGELAFSSPIIYFIYEFFSK